MPPKARVARKDPGNAVYVLILVMKELLMLKR